MSTTAEARRSHYQGAEVRSAPAAHALANKIPAGEKPIFTFSSAELELSLRRQSFQDIRAEMQMIDDDLRDRTLTPVAREALGVWHALAWAVATDRDTREIAQKWDQISRRWTRALNNGKRADLTAHNAMLAIRAADKGRRYWDVALHESAHAIIAHSQGAEIEDITVWRSDGPASVTLKNREMAWEGQIMCRVAAHEAFQLADIRAGYHCRSDLREAHEIARAALGNDEKKAAAKVKELSERVAGMLTEGKYTGQLLKVATALSERISISGDEFRELIRA
jgi:hypothetical protein